jgi:hypothetical protein
MGGNQEGDRVGNMFEHMARDDRIIVCAPLRGRLCRQIAAVPHHIDLLHLRKIDVVIDIFLGEVSAGRMIDHSRHPAVNLGRNRPMAWSDFHQDHPSVQPRPQTLQPVHGG